MVQEDFLATLGVSPILGRSFNAEEDQYGGPAVALVGYGLWKRRFGADPNLLGRSLNLEGTSTTIIGILPPAFDLPNAAESGCLISGTLWDCGLPSASSSSRVEDWYVLSGGRCHLLSMIRSR